MNLPNKLTLLRIGLTFIFMFLLFCEGAAYSIYAFLIFILASITDYYDGYIARKMGLVTNFGKLIDPIADKVLVLGAFLAFVELGIIPSWIVVLIISREFIITGLRLFAAKRGKVLAASAHGKHKTVFQLCAIFIILTFRVFKQFTINVMGQWPMIMEKYSDSIIFFVMFLAMILTVSSGVSFLYKNRNLISGIKC